MRRAAFVVSVLLVLAGCARADGIAPGPDNRPRLFYVGLGMYGETWSEHDVAALPAVLARGAAGFRLVPTVLSNPVEDFPPRFPPVDPAAVEAAVAEIAAAARPGDVVLLYVSTHGAPGLLGRSAAGEEQEPVGIGDLQRWLAPLRGQDTIVVLSACFSGSFIPALRGDHRVVFTAARADRTSFGCQAGAEHTVFGDALLRALARPGISLRAIVAATRATVAARERALRVPDPSQPQLAVGPAVSRLFDAPVF